MFTTYSEATAATGRFLAGDPVVVRAFEEILATLDADGTLDGVPFMPEMIAACGQAFRVFRRVEKTCVDGYPMRRFPANDVVILDGPRCDGTGHDGCKHACRVFWKEAWLRSPADGKPALASTQGVDALRARLKVKTDDTHYFCQSTQLYKATASFPGKQKVWMVRVVWREIRNGELSAADIARMAMLWVTQKARRALAGDNWLRGPHKKTPSVTLALAPGEIVRVKSREEVISTLDGKRRNRGMGICHEVLRCCDGEAEVRYRVDRLIDERTGVMREITDTVTLHMRDNRKLSEECLCFDQLGDCPRGELMYWREIWLERLNPSAPSR